MAITMERKKGGRPTKRPKSEAEIRKLVEMYKTHTATELAEQYGVKPGTIRSWVSHMRNGGVSVDV